MSEIIDLNWFLIVLVKRCRDVNYYVDSNFWKVFVVKFVMNLCLVIFCVKYVVV